MVILSVTCPYMCHIYIQSIPVVGEKLLDTVLYVLSVLGMQK